MEAIGWRHRCSFYSGRQHGLASSMSRFFLNNIAFSAITSKLDKDLQDDKDGYATCRHDRKRDRVNQVSHEEINLFYSDLVGVNIYR